MIQRRQAILAAVGGLLGLFYKPKRPVLVSDVHHGPFIRGTRCLLDGTDISDSYYRAEQYADGTGIAYCYKRNANGDFYCISTEIPSSVKGQRCYEVTDVAREVGKGRIEIILP